MLVALMALNFADPTLNLTPVSLDNFLETIVHDYTVQGGVMLDPAIRDVSKAFSTGNLKLNTQLGFNAIANSPSLADLDGVLCKGFPVIVGVDVDQTTNLPGHYVLVTGQSNGDHLIVDPGHVGNTSLSTAYHNNFTIRGYVADPIGDISTLDVFSNDAVELLVVNGSGMGTGFDGNFQRMRNEIVGAYHFDDSVADDASYDSPVGTYHSVGLFQPTGGEYKIVLNGLRGGFYTLSVRGYSQDGTAQTPVNLTGSAAPGSTATFVVQYSPVGNSVPTIVSVLGDLNGDAKVDCSDIGIVRSAFGKATGQLGFDPRADVNFDGVINIRDLAFVSQHLPAGTVCR
jgi:hypothetical protein